MKMSEILAGLASARTTASEQVTATTAFATAAFGTRQTVGRAMNQTRFDGLQTEGVKSHPVSFAEHREAKREKAIALFCHGFLLTLEEAVEEGDQGAIKIAGDLLSRDVMGSLKALFHIWENQGR